MFCSVVKIYISTATYSNLFQHDVKEPLIKSIVCQRDLKRAVAKPLAKKLTQQMYASGLALRGLQANPHSMLNFFDVARYACKSSP